MDLHRHYGLALEHIRSGAVPVWYAAELTDRLPDGCEFKQEVGGRWALTIDQQLQQQLAFRMETLTWLQSEDGRKGKNRPRFPEPPPGRYADERQQEALLDRVKASEARRLQRTERLKKQQQTTTT